MQRTNYFNEIKRVSAPYGPRLLLKPLILILVSSVIAYWSADWMWSKLISFLENTKICSGFLFWLIYLNIFWHFTKITIIYWFPGFPSLIFMTIRFHVLGPGKTYSHPGIVLVVAVLSAWNPTCHLSFRQCIPFLRLSSSITWCSNWLLL